MSDHPVPGSAPGVPDPMSPPPEQPFPGQPEPSPPLPDPPIPAPPMPTPPDQPDPGRPQALSPGCGMINPAWGNDGDIANVPASSPCSMPPLN